MLRQRLAHNVIAYRKYNGYTQHELAKMTKITFSQIGNIENQRIATSIDNIERLAKAFKIDPCLLLSRTYTSFRKSGIRTENIVPTFFREGVAAYAFWTKEGMEFHPVSNGSLKNSLAMMGLIQANGLTGKDLLKEARRLHVPYRSSID